MEADHLRKNPQTPQQQETLQAITSGCKRLMRLLLATNSQVSPRLSWKNDADRLPVWFDSPLVHG